MKPVFINGQYVNVCHDHEDPTKGIVQIPTGRMFNECIAVSFEDMRALMERINKVPDWIEESKWFVAEGSRKREPEES